MEIKMTLSTKPEDIDNSEAILHYMDLNPASGQNKAAAKLIRELLSAAPLVAVTDNDHAFKNFHRNLCERFGYSHDDIDWKRDQVSLIEFIATQVSPQAEKRNARQDIETAWRCGYYDAGYTHDSAYADEKASKCADEILADAPQSPVEPLTDGVRWDLFPGWLIDHCEGDIISEEGLQFALADMLRHDSVTPTASKATEQPYERVAVFCNVNPASEPERWEHMSASFESDPDAVVLYRKVETGFPVSATSKADTGEAIRNAALEEAAAAIWQFRSAENISSALMQNISLICALVRALKSATPSTNYAEIEREHLGDPDKQTGIYALPPVPEEPKLDTAPMYKALIESRLALCVVNSGASAKAIELIDLVLNAAPAPSTIKAEPTGEQS
jgi:hypothetical protein